jgi:hypothetical protein
LKLFVVVLQFLLLRLNGISALSLLSGAEQLNRRVKGFAVFSICIGTTLTFALIAVVVAVIGIGLQMEHKGYVSFSGLMISATIFAGLSLVAAVTGFVYSKVKAARSKHQNEWVKILVPLVEEILQKILVRLSENEKDPAHGKSSAYKRNSNDG